MRKISTFVVFVLAFQLFAVANPNNQASAFASQSSCALTPQVTVVIDGEFNDQLVTRAICRSAKIVDEILGEYGTTLGNVTVWLYADRARAVRKLATLTSWRWPSGAYAVATGSNVILAPSGRIQQQPGVDKWLMSYTAHELTHTLQNLNSGEARWLLEGAAQYMAVLMRERWEGTSATVTADGRAALLRNYRSGAHPFKIESERQFSAVSYSYPVSYQSFLLLMSEMEDGMDAYLNCYLPESKRVNWRTAFQECFGMTVAEFYELFDEYASLEFAEFPSERRTRELEETRQREEARKAYWKKLTECVSGPTAMFCIG